MSKGTCVATLLAFVLVTAGCSGGLYDAMGEETDVPVVVVPDVDPFAVEDQITISWGADNAADTYLLYRDNVPEPDTPTLVYEGVDLNYIDTAVTTNGMYYYRLGKRRGTRVFGPSEYVYAVATGVREDESEPNDAQETAAPFSDGLQATLHAFQDGFDNRLTDEDWYEVEVAANTRMIIQFTDYQGLANGEVRVLLLGESSQLLNVNETLQIENYEARDRTFFFRVAVDEANFFGAPGIAGGGVGVYRLRLFRIESLSL